MTNRSVKTMGTVRRASSLRASCGPSSQHSTKFTLKQLRTRYDPAIWEEADICPDAWNMSDHDDLLAPRFIDLRDFYRGAAAAGDAVLLGLT